jgi:hypothetical protein
MSLDHLPIRGEVPDLAVARLVHGDRYGELRRIRLLRQDSAGRSYWQRALGGFIRELGRTKLLAIVDAGGQVRRIRIGEEVPWDEDRG